MLQLGFIGDALGLLADGLGVADQPDAVDARQMQALSFAFHIPLVCFGIALPAIVLFTEGLWLRTGDPVYKALAKRWSKVMIVLFAVGVVTGTILSFEFGLLWPNFMATFGEVFGLAFGLEGFAFFLEAIFVTIYVYGWDKLSPRAHFLCGIPIVITGIAGTFFVIMVNGWMNDPTGFDYANGVVSNVDPWAALFNDFFWHEFVHMYLAGYVVVGFTLAGAYAWGHLKGRRDRYHRIGLVIPLAVAALATPVQLLVGDWAGRTVAKEQPVKLASFEGLPQTTKDAPFHLFGYYDEEDNENVGGIEIPYLLSILAYHDPDATVQGLNTVSKEDRPPVNVVRYSFLTMVGIGSGLAALAVWFLFTWWRRRRPPGSKWFYRVLIVAGPLAVVALICGWVTTEVGRQPWIVYNYMKTEDAVTGADGLEIAYAALVIVYLSLAGAIFWLLRRLASGPPEGEH